MPRSLRPMMHRSGSQLWSCLSLALGHAFGLALLASGELFSPHCVFLLIRVVRPLAACRTASLALLRFALHAPPPALLCRERAAHSSCGHGAQSAFEPQPELWTFPCEGRSAS